MNPAENTEYVRFSDVASEIPDPHGTKRGLHCTVRAMIDAFPTQVDEDAARRKHHYVMGAFRAYAQTTLNSLCKELAANELYGGVHQSTLVDTTLASLRGVLGWIDGGYSATSWRLLRADLDAGFDRIRHHPRPALESDVNAVIELAAIQLQLLDFVRKSNLIAGGPSFEDKAALAWDKTLETEKRNGDTNARLLSIWSKFSKRFATLSEDERLTAECLEYIRDYIGRHLREPQFQDLADLAGFGPGTTVATSRDIIDKISPRIGEPLNVNEALLPYAGAILTRYYPGWAKHLAFGGLSPSSDDQSGFITFSTDRADERFSSVLKDWEKNRPIGIQSTLQGFLQTAIGKHFETICRKMGNPISQCMHEGKWIEDPQAINQARAVAASITGSDATVDFSSASELICRVLVQWTFDELAYRGSDSWASLSPPQKWGRMLDLLRSRTLASEDQVIVLERFSATGNGFTFPLMTMIMLGLGRFCHKKAGLDPRSVRVFGDDLIVESSVFQLVERVSALLGFRVNSEKSFFNGAFRESCGVNAFWGCDITPYRFSVSSEEDLGHASTFVSVCNGLYRARERGVHLCHHREGLAASRDTVLGIAPSVLVRVLASVGDTGDTRLAGFAANVVVRNPLSDLYWRGIGLTPILVKTRVTTHLRHARGEANWAHKAYSSFIYNTRVSPRSLRGSFVILSDDTKDEIVLVPGLPL